MSTTHKCLLISLAVLCHSAAALFAQDMPAMESMDHAAPMPMGSVQAPPQLFGHEFTEPPPVPEQSAPEWMGSGPIGEAVGQP